MEGKLRFHSGLRWLDMQTHLHLWNFVTWRFVCRRLDLFWKQWLYFLGLKNHCRLLGRKAVTNLDSILKSRDITLPTKVRLVKAMVFPVVMYGCESWTIKKAERWRIDAFKLWCWRKLLRVPWTARRSNQLILKDIGFEYPLEGLMLKLKLQ